MGFERDLMPFMAIQDLWVGHGPALVVLVDERFPVGADFACEAHRFRRCLLGFRGFLLHLARLSGFLSQREQRHHERERERNQHQFFHSGTPLGWSTLAKRYWSSPSLRSAPAMSARKVVVFGMEQVCSLAMLPVKRIAESVTALTSLLGVW